MSNWYVDPVNGNDSTGDGTLAKPYKTVSKVLGGSGVAASGDTTYIRGNCTLREVLTVGITPAAETKIIADVDGVIFGGNPGRVVWSGYTTDDKTAPSSSSVVNLGGKSLLTFQNIMFGGGNASTIGATTTTSQNVTFTNCGFLGGYTNQANPVNATCAFNTPLHWLFDRCSFVAGGNLLFTLTTGSGSDYDADVLFKNCRFVGVGSGGWAIQVTASGASAQKGGGVRARNCTHIGRGFLSTQSANVATSIPCTVTACVIMNSSSTASISATSAGQITEDYNLISGGALSNVTAGTHSKADGSYAPMIHGLEHVWGGTIRPVGEPLSASPILGYGDDGSGYTVDLLNRPRPGGGASASKAIGAFERGNSWGQETSTVRTGSNAVSITGPGVHDFQVPVDATATTVSVYMRCDSTYAGTKPTVSVTNGTECGVADATSSAVTTADAWEKLSLTFTPSAKGIVTVRLVSADTNGGGKAFADDFAVV